jgi:hypothetical protein
LITETVHHLIFAVDLFHGAAGALATLLAGVMALAFGADGPGPAPAIVAAVAVAAPTPSPVRHIATTETIRRDELRFREHFVDVAAGLRRGELPASRLEDLRDIVGPLLGYARQRGASPEEVARLHASYWGAVGAATRAVKRRR